MILRLNVPRTYRQKKLIQAMRYDGTNDQPIFDWIGDPNGQQTWSGVGAAGIIIPSEEGKLRVSVGDWVIRVTQGTFHLCKAHEFEQTYELAYGDSFTRQDLLRGDLAEVNKSASHLLFELNQMSKDGPHNPEMERIESQLACVREQERIIQERIDAWRPPELNNTSSRTAADSLSPQTPAP